MTVFNSRRGFYLTNPAHVDKIVNGNSTDLPQLQAEDLWQNFFHHGYVIFEDGVVLTFNDFHAAGSGETTVLGFDSENLASVFYEVMAVMPSEDVDVVDDPIKTMTPHVVVYPETGLDLW